MNNVVRTAGGLTKVFQAINVVGIGPSLNARKWQAQLEQIVATTYPGVRGNDSMSDALYSGAALGAQPTTFNEKRVTWVPVPVGSTLESVKEQLSRMPEARLQRILSLKPILSEEQVNAIQTGLSNKTVEDYSEKFARQTSEQDGIPGEPLTYNGLPFYRAIKFRASAEEDIDTRPADLADLRVSMTGATANTAVQAPVRA